MPTQLNFETLVPVNRISTIYGYVVIPAFSYSGIIWKESSEVITQFNYSASKNFIIRELPVTPSGVNFCPVIRYRRGNTTYRYKLWSNVGERLQVDNYNGQVIKKNFSIEIWNVETSQIVSSSSAINLVLSIRQVPTDMANATANYEDATGAELYPVSEIANMPTGPVTTGLQYWYRADLGLITPSSNVTSIADQSGNSRDLTTPSGTPPTQSATGFGNKNSGSGSAYVNLGSSTRYIGRTAGASYSTIQAFVLVRQVTWSIGAVIFVGGGCLLTQNGTAGQLRFTNGITNVTVDAGTGLDYLVEILADFNGTNYDLKINVYDLFGDLKFSATGGAPIATPATSAEVYFGYVTTSAVCRIAEVFGYSAELSAEDKINIINYIVNNYNDGALLVDYVASEGIPWLDND